MPKHHIAQRSQFTLIELLVVISIIAILASMLLPALAQSRASARAVDCMSRMKQIGMATSMYTGDQDGMMPPAIFMVGGSGVGYPIVSLDGPHVPFYTGYLPLDNSWQGPFMCQTYAASGNPKVQNTAASFLKVSYTYNSDVGWETSTFKQETMKMDAVSASDAKAYLVDGIYRNATKTHYGILPGSIGSGTSVPMDRHPAASNNLLYFDGHVDKMQGSTLIQLQSDVWDVQ